MTPGSSTRSCSSATRCTLKTRTCALSRVFGDPQPSAISRINDARNPYLMALEQRPERCEQGDLHAVRTRRPAAHGVAWLALGPVVHRGDRARCLAAHDHAGTDRRAHRVHRRGGRVRPAVADDAAARRRARGGVSLHRCAGAEPLRLSARAARGAAQSQGGRGAGAIPARLPARRAPARHHAARDRAQGARGFSPMHAQRILGIDDAAESDALLHEIADHLVDPRFAYFTPGKPTTRSSGTTGAPSTVPPACRSTSSATPSAPRSSATTSSGAFSTPAHGRDRAGRRFDD